MASPALILAARINGAKSRGPKTPEGKRKSSANSLKHGLYGKGLNLDPAAIAACSAYLADYTEHFHPANAAERALVDRMARHRAIYNWAIRAGKDLIAKHAETLAETGPETAATLAWFAKFPTLGALLTIESRAHKSWLKACDAMVLLRRLRRKRANFKERTESAAAQSTPPAPEASSLYGISPPEVCVRAGRLGEAPEMTSASPRPPLPPGLPVNPAAETELAHSKAIAARYRHEFVDLREGVIDHDLFRSIPVDLMFRYNFVPLGAQNGTLDIALADPRNLATIDELSLLLHKKLRIKVATPSQISDLLKKTEQSQRVLEEVTEGFALDVVGDEENSEETLSIDKLAAGDSDIAPVIKLVDTTIFNALERRASDIHIESRDQEVVIKYRIDGVLHYAMPPIAKDWHSTILSRIKVMSELDIAERRVPQDGRFRVRYKSRLIDFRVSIMPTIHGEDAVLRVLDKESMSEKFAKLSLDVVGFGAADLAKFRRYIAEPYGMVLVTGPTGSGKTTTLYAALSEIKNDEDKIITIEDPVEYQLKGITQIPVNEKKGLTFARGLRSILRHDPDKIMVGEIRDQETAQIAINSALTGHLVFTTVHANNVVDVLGRFLNMGVEAYNFVSALNCILAQRLVRVNCEHCKRPVRYPDSLLVESGLNPDEWRHIDCMEAPGCFECGGTGFRGRTAIHELLDLSDKIRELILDRRPASEIKRLAREEGMTFLRESAVEKVRAGITTLREINKVTFIE